MRSIRVNADTSAFNCVEMKRKAQEALLAEFETRREEFATLTQFLAAKAKESEWVSTLWQKFGAKTK